MRWLSFHARFPPHDHAACCLQTKLHASSFREPGMGFFRGRRPPAGFDRSQWTERHQFDKFLEGLIFRETNPLRAHPHDDGPKAVGQGPQPAHNHGYHHKYLHHLAHAFVGAEIDLPNPLPASCSQRWLQSHPAAMLSVKGVVRFSEHPYCWYQFQRMDAYRFLLKVLEPPKT